MIRRVRINGKLDTAASWCRHFGISRHAYCSRRKRGWSRIKAITTPPAENGIDNNGRPRHSRLVVFNGTYKSIKEHCRDVGIPYHRAYQRIAAGWTVKRALTEPLFGDGMFGQKKSRLRVMCEDAGVDFTLVRNRRRNLGWSLKESLSTEKLGRDNPARYPGKGVVIGVETVTRAEASRRLGGDSSLVHARLSIGWCKDEAIVIPKLPSSEKYARVNVINRRNELISLGIVAN